MKYSAILTADIDPLVFEAIKPELENTGRSSIDITQKDNKIIFTVEADDSVAMRATLNGITKLLTVYENLK